MTKVHDFDFKTLAGETMAGETYRGRVLLIVNVASRCGFTPQYQALQNLHDRYQARGLSVLAFPSNDFGGQEPGEAREIAAFCERRFGVGFDMMAKVHIRTGGQEPLYRYLESARLDALRTEGIKARLFEGFKRLYNFVRGKPMPARHQVSWNFHKFLIDRAGRPVAHFASVVEPDDPALIAVLEEELDKP